MNVDDVIILKEYSYKDFCKNLSANYFYDFFNGLYDMLVFNKENCDIILRYFEEMTVSFKNNFSMIYKHQGSQFLTLQSLLFYYEDLSQKFKDYNKVIYIPFFSIEELKMFKNIDLRFNFDDIKIENEYYFKKQVLSQYENITNKLSQSINENNFNLNQDLISLTLRAFDNLYENQNKQDKYAV